MSCLLYFVLFCFCRGEGYDFWNSKGLALNINPKPGKIKSIAIVNKPQRKERWQNNTFATRHHPWASPTTHTPIKSNIVWPACRKMWSFAIYFKCLFCSRFIENKRKFHFKKGSHNLMRAMGKPCQQRLVKSVLCLHIDIEFAMIPGCVLVLPESIQPQIGSSEMFINLLLMNFQED